MVTQNLKIVDCEERYWNFVRLLRMDHRVTDGFVEKMEISVEQQTFYMTKNSECYRIALLNNEPIGYFGVIEDDIRICVHPDYQGQGIGKFLVKHCFEIWPTAHAKIKVSNKSSQKFFESCGYELEFLLYKKAENKES